MLFNSIEFVLFLPAVFALYWFGFGRNLRLQNLFLIAASYLFYGWWDWRFLSLIALSSLVDYGIGLRLAVTDDERKRKLLLIASLCVNLGLLGVFKYYNFFADSFAGVMAALGIPVSVTTLQVVLPVGISFYTFQTLSYTIDVFRRRTQPTRDPIAFFAFVSFFPQLVAGPIERASNLLPQFARKRTFDIVAARDGAQQALWGLFKKVVIADYCARYVDDIFANYSDMSGSTLLLGGVLFAFQIYADFSGYSDIAIGIARFFGFNLMRNFAYPYFSRDAGEFWRRWHISLSTWFRDYLYVPLGGSRGGTGRSIRNVFAIFVVSGFWHGANWTFILWGLLNAFYFVPLMLLGKNRSNLDIVAKGRKLPSFADALSIVATFGLTVVAWIVFRSDSVTAAFAYYKRMFSASLFSLPEILPAKLILLIVGVSLMEWMQKEKQHGLALARRPRTTVFRWALYYLLLALICYYGEEKRSFIYFQF